MRARREHILSDVDTEAKMATCAKCGRVAISIKPSGGRACMTRRREERARYKATHPDVVRGWNRRAHLRAKYGIDVDEWDRMLVEQSGLCWICLRQLRDPNVDHDHTTGAVRGLLCPSCNNGLGLFRDKTDDLERAIQYLRQPLP